jgi:hypothetical protein
MKNTLLALAAGAALMACSPSSEPAPATPTEPMAAAPTTEPTPPDATTPPADPAATDTCNMAQYTVLIGKPATDPAMPAPSPTVRIIHPGDQVTMDFQAARLNIEVDASGNVSAVRCG